ncbi:ANTAR domain-containing response regulator [Vreelandella aquamarina]|uniref:Two-component response regulator, AmiR/NasT family, consists of REC and RNA-binding antiterminator (ANTAR) domains n=1 Tax=Vreelandella aquamarina TaxID=77097 RepID=A0A1N6DG35_9GAMM|nr:ANTAR domain-containing protein [Halomonas meridiana]SIN61300.1 Two-component response regulator, AmiR/NasT family, consists of REC and RNA-binding antiterminator (ANTAR) domains [Halomonas meridiana]SIN69762.1 Two-component response regulator, AmiR/NasT family, consists of REC and RNA-binding antiterminator (ANTAR) domains [Halomonas meridiana]SIO27314.1 Two-component response regulator, AmiR/NasT family, consists of REC and RNA-binding antiterminator (ANTAR) domains [Halomonas meridiana]
MKESPILHSLRDLQVLVMYPEGEVNDSLLLQLIRIGCNVRHLWPPPEKISFEVDVVFSAIPQDRFYSKIKNLSKGFSNEVTFITIIEYESPTVISQMLEIGAHGVISLPINSNTILPNLVLARNNSEIIKKHNRSIKKLEEKLALTNVVNKAKILLMQKFNIEEEEAHRHLTKKSMEERKSLIKTSEEILATNEKKSK